MMIFSKLKYLLLALGAGAVIYGGANYLPLGAATSYLKTQECFENKREFTILKNKYPALYNSAIYAGVCADGRGYKANVKIPIDGIHEKDYLHSNYTITAF